MEERWTNADECGRVLLWDLSGGRGWKEQLRLSPSFCFVALHRKRRDACHRGMALKINGLARDEPMNSNNARY